jgi:hypothetical protein
MSAIEIEWVTGPPSPPPDVSRMRRAAAIRAMVRWFYRNFEDPHERTPLDEGEYRFVEGGPCDAREELETAFGHAAATEIIAAAVARIEARGIYMWAPSESRMRPISSSPSSPSSAEETGQ